MSNTKYCNCEVVIVMMDRKDKPYCASCRKFINPNVDPLTEPSKPDAYCDTFCRYSDDCDRIDCKSFN